MPKNVRGYLLRVEAGPLDRALEGAVHAGPVALLAKARADGGKYPAVLVITHFSLALYHVGQLHRDRLFTLSGLGLGHVEPQAGEVDLVEAGLQNFGMPHGGVQAEQHEEPAIGIVIRDSGSQEGVGLFATQNDDPSPALFLLGDFAGHGPEPFPLDGFVEQVRKGRELAVDGGLRGAGIDPALPVTIDRKGRDAVKALVAEERLEVELEVDSLAGDVLSTRFFETLEVADCGFGECERRLASLWKLQPTFAGIGAELRD